MVLQGVTAVSVDSVGKQSLEETLLEGFGCWGWVDKVWSALPFKMQMVFSVILLDTS